MWAVLNVESAAQMSVERHELKEEKGRQEREGRKSSSSWHLNRGNNNNDNESKVNVIV